MYLTNLPTYLLTYSPIYVTYRVCTGVYCTTDRYLTCGYEIFGRSAGRISSSYFVAWFVVLEEQPSKLIFRRWYGTPRKRQGTAIGICSWSWHGGCGRIGTTSQLTRWKLQLRGETLKHSGPSACFHSGFWDPSHKAACLFVILLLSQLLFPVAIRNSKITLGKSFRTTGYHSWSQGSKALQPRVATGDPKFPTQSCGWPHVSHSLRCETATATA